MKLRLSQSGFPRHRRRSLFAIVCTLLLAPGNCVGGSGTTHKSPQPSATAIQEAPAAATGQEAPKIPADQIDSLVAPIALYPDPLLSQVLVASTYPLEIVQLQQWLGKNQNLKDKALADAVSKQPWDASIQAMAALPDVVKRLSDDISWTTDLGNAFLAQQSDVMDAVQRMRKKAQDTGALKSNEQVKVQTQQVESKQVIVVEQASPEVVYVPSYNPTVVYGAPVYPYPPIYYPPYSAGAVVAASAISFGVGVAMGAAFGGGWGWGCGWGGNDVDINVNNNFNRNTNVSGGNRTNVSGGNRVSNTGNKWQHNPSHRGGAPYSNKATADKFGGTARGDSMANRQSSARQQIGQQGGNVGSSNRGGAGVSDRASGSGSRPGGAGVSDRASGSGSRPGGSGVSDRASSSGSRPGGSGVSDRSSSGGGDRVGSRDVPRSSGSSDRSGFGGSSGGYSGSSSRESSSRGSSSMSSSRGGGGGGGGGRSAGGGGGGGGRGGGGGGGRR
jgi:Protein of unknown function (DUF3300)